MEWRITLNEWKFIEWTTDEFSSMPSSSSSSSFKINLCGLHYYYYTFTCSPITPNHQHTHTLGTGGCRYRGPTTYSRRYRLKRSSHSFIFGSSSRIREPYYLLPHQHSRRIGFLRHGRWKNICSAEPVSSGPKPINRADLIIHLSNLQQVYAIIVSMVGCLPHHTHPQKFCVFLSDFKNRFRLLDNLTGRVQWTIHEYLKKCLWSVTGHWQKRKVAVRWHELSISIYASAVHKTATAHHAIARLFTMY